MDAQAQDRMPFLACIGFSITARCPIACHHCIIEAGPHRREEMSLDRARDWMRQAANYRDGYIKGIVFTGGEPFLNRPLLTELLRSATDLGLVPAVATNAYWATSLPEAISVLSAVANIRMLSVSTDVFHQRFIPIQCAKNALLAAKELAIPCNAAVCYCGEPDHFYNSTVSELQEIVCVVRSSITYPAGRAGTKLRPDRFVMMDNAPDVPCTGADTPLVFPDGTVVGCMGIVSGLHDGHPALLGDLTHDALADVLDRSESNVVLHLLRVWGPGELLKMLQEVGESTSLPRRFIKGGYCDLCYALRSDPRLITSIDHVVRDPALIEKVAYGRLYFLNETGMLDRVGSLTRSEGD